ncbi:hypothetical protein W911_09055 [Hyphomicrobium nitrativorans NL23]|uniref:Uncharacterized protein n=1 Tax=Hyphomicrobium nitrativorans NL23 TaxID=1029756 RepID=V5SI11_9HYPH|nr:hypothetical protein [Hyphomicrobium nitrativorans]AHB50137.1 hypothetical protein W911_09055 [Hyphomicrobium nitrativorans NL23]
MVRGNEPEFEEIKKLLRRLDAIGGEQASAGASRRIEVWPPSLPSAALTHVHAAERDVLAPLPALRRKPERSRPAIYAIGTTAAVISTVAASIMLVWLAAPARPVSGPLPSALELPNALDDTPVETVDVVRHAAWRQSGAGGVR